MNSTIGSEINERILGQTSNPFFESHRRPTIPKDNQGPFIKRMLRVLDCLFWVLVVVLVHSVSFDVALALSTQTPNTPNRNNMFFRGPSSPAKQSLSIRVVCYNVLSSHLASPSHYNTINPKFLDATNRLNVLLETLQQELGTTQAGTPANDKKKSPTSGRSPQGSTSTPKNDKRSTIFCLQEVSYDWTGRLHAFFANHGYTLVSCNYGKPFNGYMGVCLAFDTQHFYCHNVKIVRLSDHRPGGWPPKDDDQPINPLHKWWKDVSEYWQTQQGRLVRFVQQAPEPPETPPDPWTLSQNRFNGLVAATLQDKSTQKSFCIANYHMPCAYYCPQAMTIHADLALWYVQQLAAGNMEENSGNVKDITGDTTTTSSSNSQTMIPYILAGDFNTKPNEPVYQLLTTGKMDREDPFYPVSKNGHDWTPLSKPAQSAYATKHGKEPDFTNFAQSVHNVEPFVETLDYIFCSPDWTVSAVKDLPLRDQAKGPFPNLDVGESSDHVLLWADLDVSE